MTPTLSSEKGFSIIAVVVMMLMIAVMGQTLISMVGTENFSTVNQMRTTQAHYIAESGVERAVYEFGNGTACNLLTYNDTVGAGAYTTIGTLYNASSAILSSAIVIGDTIIPLDSLTGYAPHGQVTIEAEDITYGASSATAADCAPFGTPCLIGVQRGVNGTTAAAHALSTPVSQDQCLISSTGTVAGSPSIAQRVIESSVSQSGGGAGSTVQTGTAVSTANGTLTVPIPTTVDMTRSFLMFSSRHNSNRPVGSMLRGRIATPTTLEFVRVTDEGTPVPITITWSVVEFSTGVVVQRGSVNQSSTVINVPITAVASLNQAFVTWSKTPAIGDNDWSQDDPILGDLTTTTNLQFRVETANANHVIWWQVIEFTNPADIFVQRGTSSLTGGGGGGSSVNVTLPTPVDTTKTFVLVGFRTNGTGSNVGRRMLRARLMNTTTINIDRSIATGSERITEIAWQAVQLNNSVVQHGSENFPVVAAPQIVVTMADRVREVNAGAISLLDTQAGLTSTTTNTTSGATISTNISTSAANSWVIDVVGSNDDGTFSPGASQVERWDIENGRATGASSTQVVPSTSTPSMTQSHGSASFLVHALAAIAPDPGAGAITYDTQSSATDRNVDTITWPHTIGAGNNRKLIVGVATEENNTSLSEDVISVTYNGVPLTFATQVRRFESGEAEQVEIWYMDEADLPPSIGTRIVPITTVDTTRTIAFGSVQPVGGQNMGRSPYNGDDVIGVGSVTMDLAPNQITMQRDNTADEADIGWFVVEFGSSGGGGMIDWREVF